MMPGRELVGGCMSEPSAARDSVSTSVEVCGSRARMSRGGALLRTIYHSRRVFFSLFPPEDTQTIFVAIVPAPNPLMVILLLHK